MPNALPIEALKVRSLDVDRFELTWETRDTTEDALDYTFQVLRSESPEGPFLPITAAFEDRYIFVDSRVPAGDRWRQLWYKLRTVHKASGTIKDHGPVTHEAEPDLVATYIRKNEMTYLHEVTGRLVWLFKVRTFGTRCSSCWDTVSHKRTRAGCLQCYDTGFLRGYHNPIEVWMQIDPSTKATQNNPQQQSQAVMTTARTSFYPNIGPKDLVVEAENRRWRVERVTPTERLRAVIKQTLEMSEIARTDIEFRLPINLDEALKDIQPSPARMFSNPKNVHNVIKERVPDVFGYYPTYPRKVEE